MRTQSTEPFEGFFEPAQQAENAPVALPNPSQIRRCDFLLANVRSSLPTSSYASFEKQEEQQRAKGSSAPRGSSAAYAVGAGRRRRLKVPGTRLAFPLSSPFPPAASS